jgi:ABC-2 type transport system permease protein
MLVSQWREEMRVMVRNGEQLLLVLGIPVALLVALSRWRVVGDEADPLASVTPAILALAVMSTAMVSLGVSTGFERGYGVLRRLGTTPLGVGRLAAAKAGAVAVVELVQMAVLVGVAVALGFDASRVRWGWLAAAVVVGTMAFAAIGLGMAGRLRAEANLAAQNAVYLALAIGGGVFVPAEDLPAAVGRVSELLPSHALADALRAAVAGEAAPLGAWWLLATWATGAGALTARTFRWSS